MPKQGRAPQKGLAPRNCVVCGDEFQPYRDFHVACGKRSCRAAAKDKNPLRTEQALTCKLCGEEFTILWSGIGKKPPCPACAAKLLRAKGDRRNVARKVSNNPAQREANFRYNLTRYGITVEQYQAMSERQKGQCVLCGKRANPNGVRAASRLHVDHDHVTGRVRDLLCNGCNRGIGYLCDSPELLRAAAEYIERHRAAVGEE